MDDLIGFLVFLIVMGISIASKFRSDRKAAGERDAEQDRPLTLDELPESTRRMLYGEGDIPVARPRQPMPEPEAPRPARELMPTPIPARQIVLERSTPLETPQPVREQPRHPVTLERRPLTEAPMQRTQQPQPPRMHPQQARPPRQKQRQQARPSLQQAAPRPMHPMETSPPGPIPEPRVCVGRYRLATGLHSKQGLANAVLLREILGPPRAMEPWNY